MTFLRQHYRILLAIAITAVVMTILSSVIYAASTFTVNSCTGWDGTSAGNNCAFLQYYISFYNLSTNPFIDPLALIGRLIRMFNPTSYPFV